MTPSKIIIVEDDVDKIRRMLEEIKNDANSDESWLSDSHHKCADRILEKCQYSNIGEKTGFLLGQYQSNPEDSVIIVWPKFDNDFSRIDNIFQKCSECSAICFLDLRLENIPLDKLAKLELDEEGYSYDIESLASGIRIGHKFRECFGRLIVQSSMHAGPEGFHKPSSPNYYKCEYIAGSSKGAKLLLQNAIKEFRQRYGMSISGVKEISEFLWLFFQAFSESWGAMTPGGTFGHDSLQGKGKCLHEIKRFLNIDKKDKFLGNISESMKGLFWFEGNKKSYRGCRNVSPELLGSVTSRLGISADIITAPDISWCFPYKPAISILLSLKNFLYRCSLDGGSQTGVIPSVTFRGSVIQKKQEKFFEGHIELDFSLNKDGCEELVTIFRQRSNDVKKEPEQDGSISQALFHLLAGKICVKDCDRLEFDVFVLPSEHFLEFKYEKEKNRITIMWEVIYEY